ncbi:MAG: hypothetical protein JO309_09915 [Pseudonocardiales bacterium]|nr:hypothetical protein [Pseudonocardiales bacterium]
MTSRPPPQPPPQPPPRPSSPPSPSPSPSLPPRGARRRWLANAAWVVAGVVLAAICLGVFGGYPRAHSALLNLIALVLVIAAGALVWYVDERRERRG